ncbi:MAG: bifunctional demethylmenaquinone methyltransferase/2-methoxy-6-polyprenyl-1,4-benzoquinol methylase UbiE [Candidatus Atelocyanobacterium thalassa]
MDNISYSATDVQNIFNNIAPVYDELNTLLSMGQHKIWKQMAVKWSEPSLGNLGLDVCCGSGDLTKLLARKIGKTGKVIGVDFSKELLTIASQRNHKYYPSLSVEWMLGDALNLPFEDNTFDCVTMGYGLRNIIDIPRCLRELHRILKPCSKVAILDFQRPSNAWQQIFQKLYLDSFVVPVAKHFKLEKEYSYIMPSLEKFPSGKKQVKLALEAGFDTSVYYSIAGGMMGVLVGTKKYL